MKQKTQKTRPGFKTLVLGALVQGAALHFAPALMLTASLPAAAQDFSKIEVRSTRLSDTTWLLQGAGGNILMSVGEDAVFLVDDDYAPMTPKLKEAIGRITRKPVNFVLNTHWHFDHVGGNEALAREGVLVVAHDNARKRMSSEQVIALLGAKVPPSPKAALPVVTFGGDVSFHINGETIHAFHAPAAHTDGDTIVHLRGSDLIHMGDIFFNGSYPFIDASSGGTADGVLAAMDRVLSIATDKTRIIPGHGPMASKADLQRHRDLIATVTQRIRDLRKAGRSDAEIKAAKPAAEFDADYGRGFIRGDRFIDMMLGVVPR
jgi:glyoxylase-like metal-dependent hydrolase (beta-lactamase superfamily II)